MESFYGGRQGASFVIVKRYKSISEMCDEFNEGGASTSEVNYGEYVIIDSLTKNHKDNGKVFRRGMNYTQSSEDASESWGTRYSELFNAQFDSTTTQGALVNLYAQNSTEIDNFIIDWDEYVSDYPKNTQEKNIEISDFLVSIYSSLLDTISSETSLYYTFNLTNGIIIPYMANNSSIISIVASLRETREDYSDFIESINWEEKQYCAWAGAEYIGQIVGPQGPSTTIKIDSYEDVRNLITTKKNNPPTNYTIGEDGYDEYDVKTPIDLVSGKENDSIKYAWVSLRDDQGNINGCKIGFKIPYLVIEYTGTSINPYNLVSGTDKKEAENVIATYNSETHKWTYTGLIDSNDGDDVDENGNIINTHPFYQHHNLYIPHGIKGDTWTNLRKVTIKYSLVKLNGKAVIQYYDRSTNAEIFLGDDSNGDPLTCEDLFYKDSKKISGTEKTSQIMLLGQVGKPINEIWAKVTYNTPVIYDNGVEINPSDILLFDNSATFVPNEKYQVEVTADNLNSLDQIIEKEIFVIDYYNYDAVEEGDKIIYFIGNNNTIKNINIDDMGTVTITYNYNADETFLDKIIWIDTLSLNYDGKIYWYTNQGTQKAMNDQQFGWIVGYIIDDEGNMFYCWNHEGKFFTEAGERQQTQPVYKKDEDGNDTTDILWEFTTESTQKFKNIYDINVDAFDKDKNIDYQNATQKIQITYNTDKNNPVLIGAPLNYIAEAVITDGSYGTIAKGHLLIYFADKTLRTKLSSTDSNGNIVEILYPSTSLKDANNLPIILSGWYDAGLVNITYKAQEIYTIGSEIPTESPEKLGWPEENWGDAYGVSNQDGSATDLYFYDNTDKKWEKATTISGAIGDQVILQADSTIEPSLTSNGLWFVSENSVYGYTSTESEDKWIDDVYESVIFEIA